MTVHSAAEGIGVGSAFGDGQALGILITVAIAGAQHPGGAGDQPRARPTRGFGAIGGRLECLLQPPTAAARRPAFLFVEEFGSLLPVGLAFAAGAMVWMVVREVLPDAFAHARTGLVAIAVARLV